jgi:hypothetical protein
LSSSAYFPRIIKVFRAKTPRPQRKEFYYFSELGVLCAFARGLAYPIFSSSRQDAKTAKNEILISDFELLLLFVLGVLCVFARVIVYSIFSSSRQDRKENFFDPPPWRPLWFDRFDRLRVRLRLTKGSAHHPEFIEGRLCESDFFPDFLNPNSTENFKYVCLDRIIALFSWARTSSSLRGLE